MTRRVKAAKKALPNPSDFLRNTEDTLDPSISDDVRVALDACEFGVPNAHELLVGVPATVSIGSDRYSHVVVKASPDLTEIWCAETVECEPYDDEQLKWLNPNHLPSYMCEGAAVKASYVSAHSKLRVNYDGSMLRFHRYMLTEAGYRRITQSEDDVRPTHHRLHVGVSETYRCPEH